MFKTLITQLSLQLFAFLVLIGSADALEDPIQGLLSLPQVFGNGACDKFIPNTIAVYKKPQRIDQIASIQVEKNWQFPEIGGGCRGLKVRSQHSETAIFSGLLPTKELDYEFPAAIVVETHADWFRINLSNGTGWIQASIENIYFPLEQLLTDNLAHFTDSWDRLVFDMPAKNASRLGLKYNTSVEILDYQRVDNMLWFQVKFPSYDSCGDVVPNIKERTGWVPAHAANNKANIWFYSRGC